MINCLLYTIRPSNNITAKIHHIKVETRTPLTTLHYTTLHRNVTATLHFQNTKNQNTTLHNTKLQNIENQNTKWAKNSLPLKTSLPTTEKLREKVWVDGWVQVVSTLYPITFLYGYIKMFGLRQIIIAIKMPRCIMHAATLRG